MTVPRDSKKTRMCYSILVKSRRPTKGGLKKRETRLTRGLLSVNSKAVGFIEEDPSRTTGKKGSEEDIMIETPNLATALNRDEVEVEILGGRVRGRRVGRVVRIVKRAKTRFVGTIEESGTKLLLVPDDFRMYAPIVISRPPREAQKGLKALAEIKEWKVGKEPHGEIVKVLGKKGEHEVEMESIVLERGFESTFPQEVEAEAKTIADEAKRLLKETGSPLEKNEVRNRRDFRKTALFTIDPKSAKDFDDALSFRLISNSKHPGQIYEIGIHIADVSHYVREGTMLDKEARERGTSVYLVDRTIPMLPHVLSNDLCSLNPNVDRFAFSAVFEMDVSGRVYDRWFGKSVIHSKKRFTYESAQESIDSGGTYSKELRTVNTIAKNLRKEKMKQGAIDFEQDEVGFELNEKGHPVRIFKKARLETHKLVEEFMLLANKEVARFFFDAARKSGGKVPFIYRTHDMPNSEKLEQLRVFVRALGHELPIRKDGSVTGKDLQALFNAIDGHAEEALVKTAAIRTMSKAVYTTTNIGHFGLAFEYYTHFTSPIRRYPDLLVHRSLLSVLERHKLNPQKLLGLEVLASDATRKEIAASEAERESIKLKQVEYMRERIGKEYDGIISGVTEWGIYVEDKETRAEGMIPLRSMKDDYYQLDPQNYAIVGEKTEKKYSLGEEVRFRVMGADLERKTLDYVLA